MPVEKKTYVAVTGIDFEALDPPVRCEPADPLPAKVTKEQIKDLLEIGAIKLEGEE